jgi:hypothetical protein
MIFIPSRFLSVAAASLKSLANQGRSVGERRSAMLLTYTDTFAQYRIECSDDCRIESHGDGMDLVLVPDPSDPDTPYAFVGDLLIEAARSGEFSLRLVSVQPLN